MKEPLDEWIEIKGNYTWFEYKSNLFNKIKEKINMRKQEIEFRDPVVQSVVNKFVDRSDVGFAKYGKTMRDDKSDVFVWLNHLQEELMDATLYLQRLKEEISDLREEKALINELNEIDIIDEFIFLPKKKEKKVKVKKYSEQKLGRGDHFSFTIDEPDHKDWKDILDQSPLYSISEFFRPTCTTTTMPDAQDK
jgi:hypothetical protein